MLVARGLPGDRHNYGMGQAGRPAAHEPDGADEDVCRPRKLSVLEHIIILPDTLFPATQSLAE